MTTKKRLAFAALAIFGGFLALVQFVLVFQTWTDPVANAYYWRQAALVQGLAGIVYIAVGLLIVRRRPQIVIGWLVGAIGIGILLYQVLSEYAIRALLVEPVPWTWGNEAAVLSQTFWALAFGPIMFLLLVYPTGALMSRRWIWVGAASAGAMILISGVGTVALWPYRSFGADLLNLEDTTMNRRVEVMFSFGLVLLAISLVGSVASLVVRWRQSTGVVRLQLKWLLLGSFIVCAQIVTVFIGGEGIAYEALLLVGLIALPAAIAVAVLRYRLFEIDRIISRTVTYGLVSAVLILFYLGSVFVLRSVVPARGQLAVAGSTLATAALFNPIRDRIQKVVDHRFNRTGYDAEQTLAAFTGRLSNQIDLSALKGELHLVAEQTVQPDSLSVWLR